ncbi:MAG: SH3 domain-containing protein [Clostridiaceae bacterium]
MKKSISKILVILIILVYTAGCGKRSPTIENQTNSTQNPDFTLNVENIPHEENGFIQKISTSADLDGDGKVESIDLMVKKSLNEGEVNAIELHVGEQKIPYEGEMIDPMFKVVDISNKDKYLEIAISEEGPSSDYTTVFYRYDGKKLSELSKISGFLGKYPGMDTRGSVLIDHSGFVKTKSRGEILQTWFYDDTYLLNENDELVKVKKDIYEMNTEVEVIKEITLKQSKESEANGITLKVGEKVTLDQTDNMSWCRVTNSKGDIGWFEVKNFYEIVGYEGMNADEFFLGLNFAD